jgi:DNA-binding MarR family transcriptional regulator
MSGFDLDAFLPYRLNVLAGRMSRAFATLYRDRFGLSVAEWRVLAHLSRTGPVSVREITARVDLDKSRVSRAAKALAARGLVTRAAASADRRLVALDLTAEGHALMTELAVLARAFEADLAARMGPDAAGQRAALDRLFAALVPDPPVES